MQEHTKTAGGSTNALRAPQLGQGGGKRFRACDGCRACEVLAEIGSGLAVNRRSAFKQRHNALVTIAVASCHNQSWSQLATHHFEQRTKLATDERQLARGADVQVDCLQRVAESLRVTHDVRPHQPKMAKGRSGVARVAA